MGILDRLAGMDLKQSRPSKERIATYGKRTDGSPKGAGYFGEIPNPQGGYSTELSIGVNIDGQEMNIPTMVPTLSKKDIKDLLKAKNVQEIPESVVQKAVDHAKKRMRDGKSPYAEPDEFYPLPKE